MAPKLIQCIKFSFSLTAGAVNKQKKRTTYSSSVFACSRGTNTCAPSIVYRLLIGWNCHTTWSQGNLHYTRLHFLKLDREFFCLQPSLARLYSAAASPSERLRSDGSLAIIIVKSPGRSLIKFYTEKLSPEVQLLTFYVSFLQNRYSFRIPLHSSLMVEYSSGLLQAFYPQGVLNKFLRG